GLDINWFTMNFSNLVLSSQDSGGNPIFINAGTERFRGFEVQLQVQPHAWPGTTLSVGYAHHDPRFVHFVSLEPDGNILDASGNLLELAAREMFNARIDLQAPHGVGLFAAVRAQGKRAFDRDNSVGFTKAFSEFDAGASYAINRYRLSVTG